MKIEVHLQNKVVDYFEFDEDESRLECENCDCAPFSTYAKCFLAYTIFMYCDQYMDLQIRDSFNKKCKEINNEISKMISIANQISKENELLIEFKLF